MRTSLIFAVIAGVAWGIGGYYEKAGLKSMGIPPIAGITLRTFVALIVLGLISIPVWKSITNPSDSAAWIKIIIGGGIVAGSLGMWAFYSSLSTSNNLGITLAIAFACSPLAGTVLGLVKGDQPFNFKIAVGIFLLVAGIIFIQLGKD